MPYAVRQWPVAPDPRSPFFSYEGWDFGQVAPWQFILRSTNATGIYAWLNFGLVIPSISDTGIVTSWGAVVDQPEWALAALSKVGSPEPVLSPPRTISFALLIAGVFPVLDAFAGENLVFPSAIREFGPWELRNSGGPIAEVPDGVTITPAIWDFALT